MDALPAYCRVTPYDIRHNFVRIGGHFYGHGFMFGMNATKEHAEMLGGPVVMVHTHRPEIVRARTLNQDVSINAGTLADIDKLTYSHQKRSTLQHGHGLVYGYFCDGRSQLWLAQSAPGQLLPLP